MTLDFDHLRNISTFRQLVVYLRDELDWPIEGDNFEDLTFEYSAEDLGLDSATAAKVKEIKQLRPLNSKQPWGIFFVNFEPKKLPVVALRRILSTLVLKKRQSANKANQAAWLLHDLLFVSSYGESNHRNITFAHFAEEKDSGDLPTLRVLGWDDENTELHIGHVEKVLRAKLRWPNDEVQIHSWRAQWSSAFTLRPREVITTSKMLAVRLAELARSIRKRANTVLRIESEKGRLRKLYAAFKEALIHDLSEDDFADMYAQTISYGLLTARVSRPAGLVADNLSDMVPITNPFLKELLETFLTIGGRKGKIDFDELGVNEVVQLLRDADMESVLRDFGDRNPQEDPVIHFYELFLKEYDARKRVERGVFYTPRSVVSYIVRSVDELLRKEFGLEDGLADTATWDEMLTRQKSLSPPTGVSLKSPFVQILDPATGTGTFLVEAIDVIHKTMEAKWKKQGFMPLEFERLWNDYVPKHLLPRLHGFELMMAPYAIAHMKIGLKLAGTGYRFRSDERARVYLTNSLEPPTDAKQQRDFEEWAPALAHEAKAVNAVKRHGRFTVVIGNPPYAGISSNMSQEAQRLVDAYKIVDGEALNERKLWLQDDYVKFIRIGQVTIQTANSGVLGYITNHGYLDNPTFRGMRQSLLGTFTQIRILDLHGNANKKEQSPDGTEDNNVFDIRQGVAVCVAARVGKAKSTQHSELWGSRASKYDWLIGHSTSKTQFAIIAPDSPYYFLKPQNTNFRSEFDSGWKITEIMPVNCAGFITARDHFALDFDSESLLTRIADFANPRLSEAEIRSRYFAGCGSKKYPDGDSRGWKVPEARKRVQNDKDWRERVKKCLYRPFDTRSIYWADWIIDWPRPEVMRHMLVSGALALSTSRSVEIGRFEHVFCTRLPIGHHSVSLKEVNYMFPLYLVSSQETGQHRFGGHPSRLPNLSSKFLRALGDSLRIAEESALGLPKGVTPEDVFNYTYAILHSPEYRHRYADFLKVDFPRLPLTHQETLFRGLSHLGGNLAALHLLESTKLNKPIAALIGVPRPEVEKISYNQRTVWLDKEEMSGFRGVPEEVWNFRIGGYQVCEKWLKDRKGRKLSKADIDHYQKVVAALHETIRIMAEIDRVIDAHGGWPGAFVATAAKSSEN